ncbi:MAG: GNAT family N-acetyltransferase, partial [Bacilli bacterium]|nr:GNAT family N-acetyltransferase [Bacilli bacterium]
MKQFHSITNSDKTRINKMLDGVFYFDNYSSSELVFENIFVWNYNRQIEILWIEDNIAIIRSLEKENEWIFFPPICRSKDEFNLGLNYIRDNFPEALVTGLSKKMIEASKNQGCLFLYDDYYSEYIYDPKELADMSGGKFSRKRNLIAQFKKKYKYDLLSYEDIHFDKVLSFLKRYEEEGGADEDFGAIVHALKHKDELDLLCDILVVSDIVVGLSIGVISVFDHGVILFEKSDYNYIGSGTILVQLTTAKHYRSCRILSRQEDIGLPQLRKAKLALNPLYKEKKYACIFDSKTIQLYNLYLESFDDSKNYVDFFFLHIYRLRRAVYIERDNRIVSALHILMKKFVFNAQIFDLPFVVAASTSANYRRQGLMREVMSKTFYAMREKGYCLISLYPANPQFYLDYGFVHYAYNISLKSYPKSFECGLEQTNDSSLLSGMYSACIKDYEGYVVRDEKYYTKYLNSMWQDGIVFELIKKDNQVVGYVAHKNGDVEEILLCGEEMPINKKIDFSNSELPSPNGTIPSNMIRIIDVL